MAQNIKNVINTVFSKQNSWKIKLLQNWPSIIGKLKSKVRLEKINKDSLVLGVYDSCWLQELYLLSPILLKKINEKLENQQFKRLRFKQVGIKKNKQQKKPIKQEIEISVTKLTKREEETLQKIKDPDLCQALRDFLIKCQNGQES
ncbi:DUF721 domain-containing protein [Candidatus Dependentiae bacterium]